MYFVHFEMVQEELSLSPPLYVHASYAHYLNSNYIDIFILVEFEMLF